MSADAVTENLLAVTFQAAPRKAGQVRVTLCPLVRTTRDGLITPFEPARRTTQCPSARASACPSKKLDSPMNLATNAVRGFS